MTETVYIKRSEDSLESFLMNQKDYPELAALYPKLHAAIIENGQKYVNHVFEPAPQSLSDVLKENEELKMKLVFFKNVGKEEAAIISSLKQQVSVLREAVEYTLDAFAGKHEDCYRVSFLYPGNNIAFQKLLTALNNTKK